MRTRALPRGATPVARPSGSLAAIGTYHLGPPPWLLRLVAGELRIGRAVEVFSVTRGDTDQLARTFLRCDVVGEHARPASAESAGEIEVHQGVPGDLLAGVCITLTEATFFWLHGHYGGSDDTGGRCPLLDELAEIGRSPGLGGSVVAIDDARLFGLPHHLDPMSSYLPRLYDVLCALETMGLRTYVVDDVVIGVPPDREADLRFVARDPSLRQKEHLAGRWDNLMAGVAPVPPPGGRQSNSVVRWAAGLVSKLLVKRPVVVLRGGLGNHLFQCAAAISIADADRVRSIRRAPIFPVTVDDIAPGMIRQAGQVQAKLCDLMEATAAGAPRSRLGRALRGFLAELDTNAVRNHGGLALSFSTKPADLPRPIVLDGAFQHPSWFKPGDEVVVDALLKNAPTGWRNLWHDVDVTVISHRRGDYVPLGWVLDEHYYRRCVGRLDKAKPVVVVGDDPAHILEEMTLLAAQGFVVLPAPHVVDDKVLNDFWLLARAQHVVMSNSTFCWWATRVGDRFHGLAGRDRTVLAPAGWLHGAGRVLIEPAWVPVPSHPAR